MKCPSCPSENLLMTVRDGVEIDYCPICRGIWLDKGELDKLIERSNVHQSPPPVPIAQSHQQAQRVRRDDDSVDEDYDDRYRKKKRKGWLGDLLDFD